MDYSDIREKLRRRREELSQIVERIDHRTKERFSEWAGELASFDNHLDTGTDLFLREQDQAIRHRAEKSLEDVDKAEDALKKGTYGICTVCGRPIDDARLSVLPEVQTCIDCAKELPDDETYMLPQGNLEPNEFWDEMAVWGSSNTFQDGENDLYEREDEPL
ncbi:MAG: TraR/DksA C4-type zinc finger protein [Bacillota bacterium]|nr:hypothetical protein [Bacillota bacterium]HOA90564.1 TraR/DksA C4-type zinc finger protein [Bacillota bacterium]HOP54397.1 TraR/DksA C4-type zinc finger protein [Bacillota bacterium]HPT61849.1 TraR/DksA C4-type zinc finger protein [Bacillota bacterium]HPZ72679.1 TraR/DksA C4-type zinc finger protein [Bacillota bacterium]